MKYIKWIVVPVLLLAAAGFIAYQFGTAFVADKVVEQVVEQVYVQLQDSGELNNLIAEVKGNPELEKLLTEAEMVGESTLPFTTKEEATKVLLKKFSVEELIEIQSMVNDGISIEDEEVLLSTFEDKLTEEELLALKVITIKELNK
jgi:hypothetical protein